MAEDYVFEIVSLCINVIQNCAKGIILSFFSGLLPLLLAKLPSCYRRQLLALSLSVCVCVCVLLLLFWATYYLAFAFISCHISVAYMMLGFVTVLQSLLLFASSFFLFLFRVQFLFFCSANFRHHWLPWFIEFGRTTENIFVKYSFYR